MHGATGNGWPRPLFNRSSRHRARLLTFHLL
ncbi:hypothetical protein EHW99_3563 [Erwinia amylovora]|uniref:Uncharacterized protein n=2 Tax=Erwinia amylovora TaxID=552 RepID=A0A831A797_ERWAM|nr:hypothetical protein EaACW_3640 [Erwinia amylovora ACW56400]QJQ56262.1 hypothetical protein EHX00_3563 [Erwinia amylovora]CBA24004.1 hypothetical protein predicted by Glimmer/Critica [Erwinia amylovora CFBP1430]CCO84283.1 hypothetical protein BN433_3739 [Erwinia amylovora Ea266]CCO88039.1 hypothetical protein BN434_3681 [Erwinia amylovora CFBP 2585]CCO91832.1 hypothetical protein BN435_3692 [Erwinia amylovora 01SFR-BO]CCO95625.1 hypothetical protein BN437_3727 [Erwinia amylovora NBRC 12687